MQLSTVDSQLCTGGVQNYVGHGKLCSLVTNMFIFRPVCSPSVEVLCMEVPSRGECRWSGNESFVGSHSLVCSFTWFSVF